jgi:hypothetical protein
MRFDETPKGHAVRYGPGALSWAPVPAPPVVEIEVAVFGGREQERRRAARGGELVERADRWSGTARAVLVLVG